MTYLSVVSRDSVRIALTIAVLNYLNVLAWDIQNAYLTASFIERVWVVARPEFRSEAEYNMLVRKSLYVLKSSDAAFSSPRQYRHQRERGHWTNLHIERRIGVCGLSALVRV